MKYQVGQALFGKLQFTDGAFPQYPRPYLIVEISGDRIGVLNVSSVYGKEHKVLFSTNHVLLKHFPPFPKSSFVKLDSLQYISVKDADSMRLMENGAVLDPAELDGVLKNIVR